MQTLMNKSSRIFIAGSGGLVGSAIERRCRALGYENLLLPRRRDVDLCKDVSRLEALGWKAKISLDEGLASTWNWYSGMTQSEARLSRNVKRAVTHG